MILETQIDAPKIWYWMILEQGWYTNPEMLQNNPKEDLCVIPPNYLWFQSVPIDNDHFGRLGITTIFLDTFGHPLLQSFFYGCGSAILSSRDDYFLWMPLKFLSRGCVRVWWINIDSRPRQTHAKFSCFLFDTSCWFLTILIFTSITNCWVNWLIFLIIFVYFWDGL